MIVNTAVFICSICGEASSNICSYCTKDACSNHRCERCKRCSDCCECEFPLSAEEIALPELAAEPVPQPEAIIPEPAAVEAPAPQTPAPEPPAPAPPAPEQQPRFPVYLTAAESSVFVAGSVFSHPPEPTHPPEATHPEDEPPAQDPDEPLE
jgi:hypothetical protein